MEEVETTRRIRQWLTEAGIRILDLPLATGLVAEVGGMKPGPTIAIRADIDALPIAEQTGLEYASLTPGKMHACGHDFHTSSVLGAALLLKAEEANLEGTVRIFFQPAEELLAGAQQLIDAGAMKGVAAVFGAHNNPKMEAGLVGIKEGPLLSGADSVQIEITGVGGHGALPHTTKDPVVAASAIIMSLQTIVSRWASPTDMAVVSIASVDAGGNTFNVIPDRVVLRGTIRTYRPEVRTGVKERIAEIAESVAKAHRCSAEVSYPMAGLPSVSNHASAVEVSKKACEALGLPFVEAVPALASEDFALYQQEAPGCYVWIGTGRDYAWHHPKFEVRDEVLTKAAAYFAQVAVEALAAFK